METLSYILLFGSGGWGTNVTFTLLAWFFCCSVGLGAFVSDNDILEMSEHFD